MNLDAVQTKNTRKYFKCEKPNYIQRFCRNKAMKVINVSDSENEGLLMLKKSQKEEL